MDDVSLMRNESMLKSKWKFPVSPISAELSQRVGVQRERSGHKPSCFYLFGLVIRKTWMQISIFQSVLV